MMDHWEKENSKDLAGIVLMGGLSSRMGRDKALLKYNGFSFSSMAKSKLSNYCDTIYFSINRSQKEYGLDNLILDEVENEGPLSGIISSLKETQKSILVLGVDLPLVSEENIKTLIKGRNRDVVSTCYLNFQSKVWEPMLSIWEIESLPILVKYFNEGERSIQKILNTVDNQPIELNEGDEFRNFNTREDYQNLIKG